ncbi:metal-dependent hydrolase [Leptospira tipperaryensis]|uniref:Metal-dependent hydrolase n=1 Tax=Leptospira tipperaryensis TaxID=2564040 RepID=A0A1D7UU23_9LEPT|nr:SprT family zinc-dependent metalloprotease [Leptospira tipperaryensis]AOP33065.1 metal-dependent hydrolase [Leptospira tipperaryensis]
MKSFQLGDIKVEFIQKNIGNLHLSVYPPNGRVRISAPFTMNFETIRVYAISKLAWIKKQRRKFSHQERESRREYIARESHYFLGKRYLLRVFKGEHIQSLDLKHNSIDLFVSDSTTWDNKNNILKKWYRDRLREISAPLVQKWSKNLKLKNVEFSIRSMKTRWGTCNPSKRKIWLNLELAKKPKDCIEFIIAHELIHILEKNHTTRFFSLLKYHYPNWKEAQEKLNKLPISHVDWEY